MLPMITNNYLQNLLDCTVLSEEERSTNLLYFVSLHLDCFAILINGWPIYMVDYQSYPKQNGVPRHPFFLFAVKMNGLLTAGCNWSVLFKYFLSDLIEHSSISSLSLSKRFIRDGIVNSSNIGTCIDRFLVLAT